MSKSFQPMLASALPPEQMNEIDYPVFVSPKLDGVRAVVRNGVVLSRKLKPIPSLLVQDLWGKPEFEGLDGELITGPTNAANVFRRTTSCVMSINSPEEEIAATSFQLFDCVAPAPFHERYMAVLNAARMYPENFIIVPQELVHAQEKIEELEQLYLQHGFEGVMLRHPMSPYKFGRSTLNEGYLLKLKRFADDEYAVIGFDEKMHNANPQERDERGYAKRSSHQENLVGMDTLGSWVGRVLTGPYTGKIIRITPTGTHAEQHTVWLNKDAYLGSVRKFKYFPGGSKDLPRFPTDLGPRHD